MNKILEVWNLHWAEFLCYIFLTFYITLSSTNDFYAPKVIFFNKHFPISPLELNYFLRLRFQVWYKCPLLCLIQKINQDWNSLDFSLNVQSCCRLNKWIHVNVLVFMIWQKHDMNHMVRTFSSALWYKMIIFCHTTHNNCYF